MKILLSWLREFCPVDLSAEELGEVLAGKGLHVESIVRPWEGLSGVVVAKVLEVRDHPDSDKLCLARIDAGGAERSVVVGVRNMRPGDLVPYAGPGSRVPVLAEPISVRTLRGEPSEGMLCSPRELAVSADHGGILVLPAGATVGADVKAAFGLDDAALDFEVEANRSDELSVIGVAREASAATGVPLALPDVSVREAGAAAAEAATVEVTDGERCPRYLARVITGVTVGPSPIRVQARLSASGMRPLSNVVDATNYVMLEMGQPMHPFDLDLLEGRAIVVRRAREGERVVTLDEMERTLVEEDLVIADRARALAIAGVMGAAAAEVSGATERVLVESATFSPRHVMRTSRRLQLQTEASIRFARGADPEAVGPAAARAARLMVEWGGGEVRRGSIDVGVAPPRRRLTIRPGRATAVLGYEVSAADVGETLGRLGMATEKAEGAVLVEVPGFRPDLQREVDLIEEVLRVQGYDRVGSSLPAIRQAGGMAASYALRGRVREILVRAGLREAMSLSFGSPADLELMGHDGAIRVANPPSAGEPFLRTSLIPGLLRALARNASRGVRGASLFEVGHVFRVGEPVEERESVAAVLSGRAGEGVHAEGRDLDVYDAKGAVEVLMGGLGVSWWSLGGVPGGPYHPSRSVEVVVAGRVAGAFGELHPRAAEWLDVDGRVAMFDMDVAALAEGAGAEGGRAFRDVPRFPPVHRDLAFVIDQSVQAGDLRGAIEDAGGDLVERVVLFDVFSGPPVPAGSKSLAFSIDLRAPDRTLTDDEAEKVVAAVVKAVAGRFGGELRTG